MSRSSQSARGARGAGGLAGGAGLPGKAGGTNQRELDERAWRASRGLAPQKPKTGRGGTPGGLFGRRDSDRRKREADVDRSRARLAKFMEQAGVVRVRCSSSCRVAAGFPARRLRCS